VVVPGIRGLSGVACPSVTTCEAVGSNSSGGVVVPITSGTPGSTVVVPGTAALGGVACPSATTCEAVGSNSSGEAVVVPITSGIPGSAVVVPGTAGTGTGLHGVACPSATTCEAVGSNSSLEGVVVPITSGIPGSAVVVPGTYQLSGVACPSATVCEAVGVNFSDDGVVVPITSGTPGSAVVVPGTELLGVACPSATTCEAVGINVVEGGPGEGVVVLSSITVAPTLSVTDNSQSISTGGTLVFTATVTGPSGGATPTGTLTWAVTAPGGGAVPCSSTAGPTGASNVATYTCSISSAVAGAYSATANYPGDSNYSSATAGPFTVIVTSVVSLVFSGSLSYTNSGPITSGSLKVSPSTGTITSVTGTLTIPGLDGGAATVSVAIVRLFGLYIGVVSVSDPGAHLDTTAIVLSKALTPTANGEVTGTASGLSGRRLYTLVFTI
jgi:hypothetical protein